jgi:hypothetical protein
MKRHLCIAAVAALELFGAKGAFAQAATQNITINATVPGYCTVGGGATASTSATIPVTNGAPNTSQITVAGLGSVICNENATLTLSTLNGGVTGPGAVTGFSNRIDYTAAASYGTLTPATISLTTSGTPGASSAVSSANTDGASSTGLPFSVKITPATPVHTLVAGAYSDTLSVLVTPHL